MVDKIQERGNCTGGPRGGRSPLSLGNPERLNEVGLYTGKKDGR